ncbi:hypothetical protein [Methanocella conradii]|uniref:hypothetical protein n=1 Tax=Methanocella conradii TaxID=1175444 RepID=UPI00157CA4B1|nr:hypothetical protein [Methanocella conradii]
MSKKPTSDSLSRKMELINKKVREINERRRGMRVTRIEDELDRQELRNYVRLMGLEQEDISLEPASEEVFAPRGSVFYLTLAVEALIELVLLYISFSYLLAPGPTSLDYLIVAVLLGMFCYLGYVMYASLRGR